MARIIFMRYGESVADGNLSRHGAETVVSTAMSIKEMIGERQTRIDLFSAEDDSVVVTAHLVAVILGIGKTERLTILNEGEPAQKIEGLILMFSREQYEGYIIFVSHLDQCEYVKRRYAPDGKGYFYRGEAITVDRINHLC